MTVRSLERAFELLEHLTDAGGELALSELTEKAGLPMPTVYRLMQTMVARGYVRQEPSRRYSLGPRLIRLGEGASRGDEVVYVAQVPSRHSMRMFTEVGRRVLPHCTGVGKALLAQLPEDDVRALLARTGMPARTPHTRTDPDTLLAELETVRELGYALDDEEQELGVRCVAVPLSGVPVLAAFSVSGPSGRMTPEAIETVIPVMRDAVADFTAGLAKS